MNIKPSDDFLDMLISGKGEEYLDREIVSMKERLGEEQFLEFTKEYCEEFGESENIYAAVAGVEKKVTNGEQEIGDKKSDQQLQNQNRN